MAYETGCVGVIYDPEDGILGKYSVEESVRTAKNWMDKSMQAARRYGLCCGVSSYEIPHWIHPNLMPMLGAMADAGCDFVIPQSYRAKAKYKPKGMYRGLKDYKDAGFKNILAMGGNYGKGYEAMYPQYGSTQNHQKRLFVVMAGCWEKLHKNILIIKRPLVCGVGNPITSSRPAGHRIAGSHLNTLETKLKKQKWK